MQIYEIFSYFNHFCEYFFTKKSNNLILIYIPNNVLFFSSMTNLLHNKKINTFLQKKIQENIFFRYPNPE